MSIKIFTDEEQRLLLQNPYTKYVTTNILPTTKEFKKEFLKRYLNGDRSPTQIVSELGYDPKILGYSRISGIRHHIMEKYRAGEPLEDGGYMQKIKDARNPAQIQAVFLQVMRVSLPNYEQRFAI